MNVDRWLGAALIGLAIAWLWLVHTYIPNPGTEWPGPRGFPVLLGVILALLGAWMSVSVVAGPLRGTHRPDDQAETTPPVTRREVAIAGGTFGLLILYAFLLDTVGFVIATPLVIMLNMFALIGTRRWRLTLAVAVGFTFGCWAIFDALLGTPLSRGTSWTLW